MPRCRVKASNSLLDLDPLKESYLQSLQPRTCIVQSRLVQSFQLSFILIMLLYYRYIHFLFSNTPMKAKTVTTK